MRPRFTPWAALALTLIVGGCSGRVPVGSPAEPDSGLAPALSSNPKLMIFGGTNHETYLGCLNCSESAADSMLNKYGSHGSPYSAESIFNHYGQFGSRYSTGSPCNQYSTDPPVIVDGGIGGVLVARAPCRIPRPKLTVMVEYALGGVW